MNRILARVTCFFLGHLWRNDNGYSPVHGFGDIPEPDSYCARCFKQGKPDPSREPSNKD